MKKNEYASISEFQGAMSQQGVANPDEFERINYINVIETYAKKHLKPDSPAAL